MNAKPFCLQAKLREMEDMLKSSGQAGEPDLGLEQLTKDINGRQADELLPRRYASLTHF